MSTLTIRRTSTRAEFDAVGRLIASLVLAQRYGPVQDPALADGTTDGKIKSTADVDYHIGTGAYAKSATDELWDLSAETDTAADEYRAYWLLLDSSGTASIAASGEQASAAAALEDLPALDGTKAVIGVYVAGLSCDFNGAAGLEAQGTLYDGIPEGAALGGNIPGTYTAAVPLFSYT